MRLVPFIACRYLFAKKSHNVINIISAISAIGMSVGTAALIIILSVYNGFDSLIRSMMSDVEPDLLVTPASGKVFVPEGEAYDWLYGQASVKNICCTLQEDAPIRDRMTNGTFTLHRADVPMACAGTVLAHELGINPRFLSPIEIYFPSRTRRISMSNPAAAIECVKVWPAGIFSISSDIDKELLIVPIEKMRELLEYEDEVSAVEIRIAEGYGAGEAARLKKELETRLGDGFEVRDRFMQNETLYKMMKYEKAAIYMILIFVIIIIAFNIFGSLSMLIIEKSGDIATLRSLGAPERLIRRIFVLEGWLISLTGLAGGLVVGIGFSLLQQHFGFIKMPGHFVVQAYPVILSAKDILLTCFSVAAIGYIIALLPVMSYGKFMSDR